MEIKFRAFQKSKGIMRNVWEINFEGADDSLRYIKIDDGKRLYPEDNDFVLMQFTGLKDKNGKDIYEGDIVKYFDTVAEVCWDEQYLQWYILWADKEDSEAMYVGMDLEIIGNIHENPELLETQNSAFKTQNS